MERPACGVANPAGASFWNANIAGHPLAQDDVVNQPRPADGRRDDDYGVGVRPGDRSQVLAHEREVLGRDPRLTQDLDPAPLELAASK